MSEEKTTALNPIQPLALLGDADAVVCEGDVCEIPAAAFAGSVTPAADAP